MRLLSIFILLFLLTNSCYDLQTGRAFNKIASGNWRGTFLIEDEQVPILFEIKNTDNDKDIKLIFKDGENIVEADEVRIWGDSLFAVFKKTKKQFRLKFEVDQMNGFLYDNTHQSYPIQFTAQYAVAQRFPDVRIRPVADLTGSWSIEANYGKNITAKGNLSIVAQKNKAKGHLQLETGIDMEVEGTIQGNQIYLSGFDGGVACLLYAEIANGQSLIKGSLIANQEKYTWFANAVAGIEQQ